MSKKDLLCLKINRTRLKAIFLRILLMIITSLIFTSCSKSSNLNRAIEVDNSINDYITDTEAITSIEAITDTEVLTNVEAETDFPDNISANIVNRGHIAKKDNWIYGTLTEYIISKVEVGQNNYIDLTKKDYVLGNIYIVGNHIYFIKIIESDPTMNRYVYRITTDGKEEVKILDKPVSYFYIYKGKIYYSVVVQDENRINVKYQIFSTDMEGKSTELVYEEQVKTVFPYERFVISNNYIYFMSTDKNSKICKYDLDKKSVTELSKCLQEEGISRVRDFIVDGEYIYFTEIREIHGSYHIGELYRLAVDDSEIKWLLEGQISWYNFDKDWIYFSWDKENNFHNKVYKMRKDGSQITKMADIDGRHLNIIDDWVYCKSGGGDGALNLYKIKKDGSEYFEKIR